MMDIRHAGPEDLGAIKTLLAVCLLPTQDITGARVRFVVAESDRGIIGVSGIENCGNGVGLLRSVAVMPGYRKQQIGRRLANRAVEAAEQEGVGRIFVLTESACDYFSALGFAPSSRETAPAELGSSALFNRLCSRGARLMSRDARAATQADATKAFADIAHTAQSHFDAGYYCAESVLLAVSERAGIRSPLLPAIATGFCSGLTRSWGTCGALSGGVMAVSLAYGRSAPGEPVAENNVAVRRLIEEFGKTCGATHCSELLGCDLDTQDGRKVYEDDRLRNQCRDYIGTAARIAAGIVQDKVDLNGAREIRVKSA